MAESKLLNTIFEQVPEVAGKLRVEKIHYHQQKRAAIFYFLSDDPIGEAQFLAVKKALAKQMPGIRVSLRTASPDRAADFMRRPDQYADILNRFLMRKYPAMHSWVREIGWLSEKDALVLEMPDEFSLGYMRDNQLHEVVRRAVGDIFRIEPQVVVRLKNDAEERLKRIEALRREDEERKQQRIAEPEQVKPAPREKKKEGTSGLKIRGAIIKDEPVDIGTLNEMSGTVAVRGKVVSKERRDIPGKEMVLLSFVLNDATGSIKCKIFLKFRNTWGAKAGGEAQPPTQEERDAVEKVIAQIEPGTGIMVRGSCEKDSFDKDIVLMARDIMRHPIQERMDHAERKRVELHAHTQMSNMDATVSASDLIKRAAKWGHPAIAVTDSGVVQAFPEAFSAAKKYGIKLIPGMEGYMIDTGSIVRFATDVPLDAPIIVLDFETTGLNTREDRIIEIGAVKLAHGEIIDSFSMMVDPGRPLAPEITRITGITDQMVMGQPKAEEALPKLLAFMEGHTIAAHNARFDCSILSNELNRLGMHYDAPELDTLTLAQKLYPDMARYRLAALCKRLGVSLKNAHRAVHDATATAQCLAIMLDEVRERGAATLQDIDRVTTGFVKTHPSHVVLLAASQQGIFHINKLVSAAHLEYFNGVPTIPKSLIEKYREGILVGSACEEGELYRAILEGENDRTLEKIAAFYDYLEVQPNANHAILLKQGLVKDEKELTDITRKIIRLGEKLSKPVVATGDVHYLEKEDSAFRRILQFSQNVRSYDTQPEVYFRTTEEMLKEFAFLGEEKAEEIVIDNPLAIVERVGDISLYPKHPENKTTFSPVWETAEDDIRTMTMQRAHELYGEELPGIISARLKKELDSIIGYGYATLYSIANKLVANSLANGYIVGSRGSVGSSLVATMCGITEVNPLPPHYRCPKCRTSVFDVPKECKVGVDLPDRLCDCCGTKMVKDGFDIPFEVFLGFKGDKVPDIDLNFSGEYQGRAHAYVEELFGVGYVFRAGTIGTLQEKTAYGLVLKYLRENEKTATNAEVDRLVQGCVGVKRTTGQHPGGMVILPKQYDIAQFTAVQHPADKEEKGIVTTHYDFNSMHDILVKLDILGHDDPTIIHRLEELTGAPYSEIPLDDQKVMSLFTSPEALGVTPEQIGCETGTLGVPEFGTPFVRQMLMDTKPHTMEELIRISGLSHGTDVWLGNAKDIILSHTAQLKDCICIRDDIMNYLISIGVPAKPAFDIMENVRKGKKLSAPDMESTMREHAVPEWFIESCKKIGYLFPKGHAVAYVTMALRVAWYKVYHPLAYYAAYFSIRCSGFDAETMIRPIDYLRRMLDDLKNKDPKELSGKEKDEIVALEVVIEMNARGFRFLPVDLYKSEVSSFVMEDGALRCPFNALSGFGEQAAQTIVEERARPFLSIEDLKKRTKVTAAGVEMLKACGAIRDISETDQITFF